MTDNSNTENKKFYQLGKELADTEKSVRDKAVDKIKRVIVSLEAATETEMMKLWKGLFYTFWMSDKAPVQESLADLLSSIIFDFRTESLSFTYITCFWKTMIREWGGLDRYRMDKYLLLIRKVISKTMLYIDSKQWKEDLLQSYSALILDVIANTDYIGPAVQFSECFLDEMNNALPNISSYDFMSLMKPVFSVFKTNSGMVLVNNIKIRVFNSLLTDFETMREKGDKEDRPEFACVDLRYLHSILYEAAFGKNDEISSVRRQAIGKLELAYEAAIKERFDEMEPPVLSAPSRAMKRIIVAEKEMPKKEKKEVTPLKNVANKKSGKRLGKK